MELLITVTVVAIIILIIVALTKFLKITIEPGNRRAGRYGEALASKAIKSVLRDDDLLFTNVEISFDNRPTELDNVIVNHYGVFIIEVKNYNGRLYGAEDDFEWIKIKDDSYGNTFERTVKNPIKQVKRQIYLFAKYLDYYGINVWVEGYTLLIHDNSPFQSPYFLTSVSDINKAIHTPGKNRLTKRQVESIERLLQQ